MKRETSMISGKLLSAIAWADGEIQEQEIDQLKRWFSMQKELGQKDWVLIRLYLEYPLTKSENDSLLHNLSTLKLNNNETDVILSWIKNIAEADGVVDDAETSLCKQIKQVLLKQDTTKASKTPFSLFKRKINSQIDKPKILIRDRHLDDFFDNPIFFRFYRAIQQSDVFVSVDKESLRKVCYAASLLIMISQADDIVHKDEILAMGTALNHYFKIPSNLSDQIILHGYSLDKDMLNTERICRKFLETVNKIESQTFLAPLIEIVWADGKILPIEKKVFKNIAQNLKIPDELVKKHVHSLEKVEERLENIQTPDTLTTLQVIQEHKEQNKELLGSIMWPPKEVSSSS
tara:strand:- start:151 stop:1191 length:1041 start_codon:yes stop_codon:yes gene_type:complete